MAINSQNLLTFALKIANLWHSLSAIPIYLYYICISLYIPAFHSFSFATPTFSRHFPQLPAVNLIFAHVPHPQRCLLASSAAAAPPYIIRAWQKFVNFKLLTRKQRQTQPWTEASLEAGNVWQHLTAAYVAEDEQQQEQGAGSRGGACRMCGQTGPGCAMMDSQVLGLRQ